VPRDATGFHAHALAPEGAMNTAVGSNRSGSDKQCKLTRKLVTPVGLILLIAAMACGGGSSSPQPPQPPPPTASPDVRADYLVGQMTLDEKIQLVHGGAALDWWNYTLPRGAGGWIPGIPRLAIPDLYFADGSVGVG